MSSIRLSGPFISLLKTSVEKYQDSETSQEKLSELHSTVENVSKSKQLPAFNIKVQNKSLAKFDFYKQLIYTACQNKERFYIIIIVTGLRQINLQYSLVLVNY